MLRSLDWRKQALALKTPVAGSMSDMTIFKQLSAIRFELQHETVFVAQPADVEIIFECLVVVL